jgi:hypothetical protein
MRLIILNDNYEVINKILSISDLTEFIKTNNGLHGFQYIISLFKYFLRLDISNYNISDINLGDDFIILKIKPEDLSEIRELKLKKILP